METGSSVLKVPDVKGINIYIYKAHQHVSICIYIYSYRITINEYCNNHVYYLNKRHEG